MTDTVRTCAWVSTAILVCGGCGGAPSVPWAEIRVVDRATGRGVPLVELETVDGMRFVTDNAGRVAFDEPAFMGRATWFTVASHGYAAPPNGFGEKPGVSVVPRPGTACTIEIDRRNVAERLCRLTGAGLHRDSLLLGHGEPPTTPRNGMVAGQDTVQAVEYRGRIRWFWGDTARMGGPLGMFRTAGATTAVPDPDDPLADPAAGIPFEYFVDGDGFVRAMMPLPERPEGVIWIESVFVVPDATGRDRLVAHYSRRKGLDVELEQGIAVYDDDTDTFTPVRELPLAETWRRPRGHPVVVEEGGTRWLLFGRPVPEVRVRATLDDVLDPGRYEALVCAAAGDGAEGRPDTDADGRPRWRWTADGPPTNAADERRWIAGGLLRQADARRCPVDAADPSSSIELHSGTIRWNPHRRRWVLIAGQVRGGPSMLGEVWYAEAAEPTGPFARAVRIVTHDRQSFYNVCHHAFLDRAGGRFVHFEGTYTHTFSGNPVRTPRYDYNQVLYRLDLDDPALRPAHVD